MKKNDCHSRRLARKGINFDGTIRYPSTRQERDNKVWGAGALNIFECRETLPQLKYQSIIKCWESALPRATKRFDRTAVDGGRAFLLLERKKHKSWIQTAKNVGIRSKKKPD